tara:strand:- start:107 stop:538 length:432 start_codon:yes stop_codon:yes gene_type:complete
MIVKEPKLISINHIQRYLRDNVKGWNDEDVSISKVDSRVKFTFVSNRKLKTITTYTGKYHIDLLVPKFEEIFEGKPWDEYVYYQPYYHIAGSIVPIYVDEVYQIFHPSSEKSDFIGDYRRSHDDRDYGFREVPKPKTFLTFES